MHGLALLTRLRGGEGAQRLLPDNLLPDLVRCAEVQVLPDNDPGEQGTDGRILAGELVGWLRQKGITSRVVRMGDLGLNYDDCKDLGDAAKARAGRGEP
jgi:hypothetical protein